MSKKRFVYAVVMMVMVLGVMAFVMTGTSAAQGPDNRPGRGGAAAGSSAQSVLSGVGLPPASEGGLTNEAIAALNAGIQDEYHAYATYQAIIDQFGEVRPFTNIQASEASHISALATLFDRYGLLVPEPVALEDVPVFASLMDACAAGAAAEIANFELYDQWLDDVSAYPDLVAVFTALRDASEFNHLPAFERCAG